MDRNLALEAVRVTEAAALASARSMGRGDRNGADQLAVEAMRKAFNDLSIDGEIVIGEGERDEAPMLYIGEEVGTGTPGPAGGDAGGAPRGRHHGRGATRHLRAYPLRWLAPPLPLVLEQTDVRRQKSSGGRLRRAALCPALRTTPRPTP